MRSTIPCQDEIRQLVRITIVDNEFNKCGRGIEQADLIVYHLEFFSNRPHVGFKFTETTQSVLVYMRYELFRT